MKYFYSFLTTVFLGTGLGLRAELINGVNVIVNDSVITYDQIERSISPIAEMLASRYRSQPQAFDQELQRIRTEKIEQLVQRKLIVNEFKTAGYSLPESFIDDAIKTEIQKNYYGDRARLTKTLRSEGISYEEFRQQQRERIIEGYMREQNVSLKKIVISPSKIETYYAGHQDQFKVSDQVKVRVIVINQPSESPAGAAKKIAQEVLQKLEEGVSFAEMAGIYSSSAHRAEGGDRGWVDRQGLAPELVKVAFSLKPGQRSGIIESPEACYLLLVEDVRPAHVKPVTEVRSEIEDSLKTQELTRLQKKWIDRLKAKSFVRYY